MPDRGGGDLEPLDPLAAPGRGGATTAVRPPTRPPGPPAPDGGPPNRVPRGWIALGLAVVLVAGAVVSALGDTGGDDRADPAPDERTAPPTPSVAGGWARIAAPDPGGLVEDLVVDGDDVVAVGGTGGADPTTWAWLSHDAGASWSAATWGGPGGTVLHAVVRAPAGGFVAVGEEEGHPVVYGCRCADGDDQWRVVLADGAVDGAWTDVAPLGDHLLVLGDSDDGVIAARTIDRDGLSWVRVPAPGEPVVSAVGSHGGRVVAVGSSGRVWTSSPDARRWGVQEPSREGERYLAIASSGEAVVAAAVDPGGRLRLARADNEGTAPWTWIDPLGVLRYLDPSRPVRVAVDTTGVVVTATTFDGRSAAWVRPGPLTASAEWARVGGPAGVFPDGRRVTAVWTGAGRIWLGGDGLWARDDHVPASALLVTPDATFRSTLQEVDAFAGGRAQGIARSGSELVAVGTAPGGTTSAVWRSPDGGLTWARVDLPDVDPDVDDAMTLVATEPIDSTSGVVAIRRTELDWLPWWSPDGIAWTPAEGDAFEQGEVVESVVGTDDGWTAVGWSNAWGAARAWRSADGLRWERVSVGVDADACCLVLQDIAVRPGGGLVAVGARSDGDALPGVVLSSPDGRAWTELATVDGPLFAAAVTATGGYVALGRSEQRAVVWWSDDLLSWDLELLGGIASMRDTALAAGPSGVVVTNAGDPGWIASTPSHERPMEIELLDAEHAVGDVLVDERGVAAVGVVALVAPGGGPGAPARPSRHIPAGWSDLPPGPHLDGYDATLVATDHELVVWGGTVERWDGGGRTATVDLAEGAVWDPGTGRWRAMAPAPITGRSGAAGVWTGSEVIVWGGHTATPEIAADGARYDPATDTWAAIPPAPRGTAGRCDVAWSGSELVVPSVRAAYDPRTDAWRDLPDPPPSTTGLCAAAVVGGTVYSLVSPVDGAGTAVVALGATGWTTVAELPWDDGRALLARGDGTLVAARAGALVTVDPTTGATSAAVDLPLRTEDRCGFPGLAELVDDEGRGRLVVSTCTGVVIEQPGGAWYPTPAGHVGWTDGVVLGDLVVYPGLRALVDATGVADLPLALGPVAVDVSGVAVTDVVGGADGVRATLAIEGGGTCAVATTAGDAAVLVDTAAAAEGATRALVQPLVGGAASPVVQTQGGRTVTWAHDPSTVVTVRCDGGGALALARRLAPPTQLVPSGG